MDFSFIKKYIRPAKKEWREKQERSPELDWRVLLFITFFLYCVAIGSAMYVFFNADENSGAYVAESGGTKIISAEMLHDVVVYYEGKVKELEILKENGIDTADPSR